MEITEFRSCELESKLHLLTADMQHLVFFVTVSIKPVLCVNVLLLLRSVALKRLIHSVASVFVCFVQVRRFVQHV